MMRLVLCPLRSSARACTKFGRPDYGTGLRCMLCMRSPKFGRLSLLRTCPLHIRYTLLCRVHAGTFLQRTHCILTTLQHLRMCLGGRLYTQSPNARWPVGTISETTDVRHTHRVSETTNVTHIPTVFVSETTKYRAHICTRGRTHTPRV